MLEIPYYVPAQKGFTTETTLSKIRRKHNLKWRINRISGWQKKKKWKKTKKCDCFNRLARTHATLRKVPRTSPRASPSHTLCPMGRIVRDTTWPFCQMRTGPETMRRYDGRSRWHCARRPTRVQRKDCIEFEELCSRRRHKHRREREEKREMGKGNCIADVNGVIQARSLEGEPSRSWWRVDAN